MAVMEIGCPFFVSVDADGRFRNAFGAQAPLVNTGRGCLWIFCCYFREGN